MTPSADRWPSPRSCVSGWFSPVISRHRGRSPAGRPAFRRVGFAHMPFPVALDEGSRLGRRPCQASSANPHLGATPGWRRHDRQRQHVASAHAGGVWAISIERADPRSRTSRCQAALPASSEAVRGFRPSQPHSLDRLVGLRALDLASVPRRSAVSRIPGALLLIAQGTALMPLTLVALFFHGSNIARCFIVSTTDRPTRPATPHRPHSCHGV